jgi:uncharacterized membrane protein
MAGDKPVAPAVEPEAPAGPVDHVAMVSYNADGTPNQTAGFVVLVDPDAITEKG